MPICKDCIFYEPITDRTGHCFGNDVPANRNVEECPANAFQPK